MKNSVLLQRIQQTRQRQPRDWRNLLAPGAAVGAGLATAGTFMLYDQPKLAPQVGIIIAALFAATVTMVLREDREQSLKKQPSVNKPRYQQGLCAVASASLLWAGMIMLFASLVRSNNPNSNPHNFALMSMLVALTNLTLYAFRWKVRADSSSLERFLNSRPGTAMSILLLLILYGGGFLISQALAERSMLQPPATWGQQLQAARQEAMNYISDMVLDEVDAHPYYSTSPSYSSTLRVGFAFLGESTSGVEIELRDSSPTGTAHRWADRNYSQRYSDELVSQLRIAQDWVRIGPREAIEITLTDGKLFAEQNGEVYAEPSISLIMGEERLSACCKLPVEVLAVWNVSYYLSTDSGGKWLQVTVNAYTGEILERQLRE